MNLLFLSPARAHPARHGAGVRMHRLGCELAKRHRVTVVSFGDEPASPDGLEPPPYEHVPLRWNVVERPRILRWFHRFGLVPRVASSPENDRVVGGTLRSRAIDVVVGQYVTLAPLFPLFRDLPVVWAVDGIFSELRHPGLRPDRNAYRRAQDWLEYLWWRRLETWTWRQADVLVAVSEPEAAELRRRIGRRIPIVVAPNGADCHAYAGVEAASGSPVGIFVASTWHPNVEALHFFADEILPRIRSRLPAFRLRVAGGIRGSRHLRPDLPGGIDLLGWVDDLRTTFAGAGVFVAPLLRGHGTRMKLLEAMAAGMPIVSTTKGAEGLDVVGGRDLLLADDAEAFAEGVVRVIREPGLAGELSASARRLARDRYDWPIVAARLEEAIELAATRRL